MIMKNKPKNIKIVSKNIKLNTSVDKSSKRGICD